MKPIFNKIAQQIILDPPDIWKLKTRWVEGDTDHHEKIVVCKYLWIHEIL